MARGTTEDEGDTNTDRQQITRIEVPVSPFGYLGTAFQAGSSQRIKMDNLGTDVLKAVYRDTWLYLTMNDAKEWFGDSQMLNSVRFVRLNVANYPNIVASGRIDRVFGANNAISDAPNDHMYYGWPALEVNRAGDVVIVYARSGTRLFPEVRYSAYLFTETDIRPSRLLKSGEDSYLLDYPDLTGDNELRWGDTAGASVDPTDDTAIWIAQAYASDERTYQVNNWAVWVGKIHVNSQVP